MPSLDRHQLEQLASAVTSLRSGKYSDFAIRCTDNTLIRVHRAIICPRSKVLSAAIDGVFKEALSQEIFLEDDEPLIVAKMIDFLYSLDYDDHRLPLQGGTESIQAADTTVVAGPPVELDPEGIQTADIAVDAEPPFGLNPTSLLVNAKAYIMAEKYDIQSLKDWAVTKYKEVLLETWDSTSFIESARLVFENTPESDQTLREAIVRKAGENAKALFDREEFVTLLKSHGDLAVEILRDTLFNDPEAIPEPEVDGWGLGTKKKDKKKRIVHTGKSSNQEAVTMNNTTPAFSQSE